MIKQIFKKFFLIPYFLCLAFYAILDVLTTGYPDLLYFNPEEYVKVLYEKTQDLTIPICLIGWLTIIYEIRIN